MSASDAGTHAGGDDSSRDVGRNSPASSVCYLNELYREPQDVTQTQHAESLPPAEEAASTPRTEGPPAAMAPAACEEPQQHGNGPSESGYFSPRPMRFYPTYLPPAPQSTEPSPTPSRNTSTSSVNLAQQAPAAGTEPPTPLDILSTPDEQPDLSSTSTASQSSIRASSTDQYPLRAKPGQGYPQFPNQAYSALQSQVYPTYHPHILRTRTAHPVQHSSFSATHISTLGHNHEHDFRSDQGVRTAGNSPAASPSLFSPPSPSVRPAVDEGGLYASPYLHFTHRQQPKETHVADVDYDPVSGRKMINQYEIIDELGRGVHGKVKLGRSLETGKYVAIKIVDRYSKKRRLGKNASHEDKIKREIAILKKARHPNIVGLLEVIDDPTRKKVYIVLEHVEMGEVKWRTEAAKEIGLVQYRRALRESKGIFDDESALLEDEKILHDAQRRREKRERRRLRELQRQRAGQPDTESWSFEHGGDTTDDDSEYENASRVGSNASASAHGDDADGEDQMETVRQSPATVLNPDGVPADAERHPTPSERSDVTSPAKPSSTPLPSLQEGQQLDSLTGLEGTMYGAYEPEVPRGRTPSIAGSTTSRGSRADEISQIPEHFRYCPLMTLSAARSVFRDTVLGLEYLHYQGVIHRDIKPANLLQTKDHHIKISDFGVSYLGRRSRENSRGDDQSESDVQDVDEAIELAKTVGTPAFYAPELCQTDENAETLPVTGAIDIWALGVTLYCLIYGRVPYHDHNTFVLMRQIADEKLDIPRFRLKAVDEQSSRSSSHNRFPRSTNSNKRSPYELVYEEIEDDLNDLLYRLLTKDPRRRISLLEVKHHPWILRDIPDPARWLDESDPARAAQGKKIEISKQDVDEAVVPVKILDRVKSGLRKLGGAIGLGKSTSSSRRRAKSSAAQGDHGPPSNASSSSNIIRDARRPSLRVDETIFLALKSTRDGEHPLSQSVTASPENRDNNTYFGNSSRPESPAITEEHMALSSSTVRPAGLERATSTAESVRTVRQPEFSKGQKQFSPIMLQGLPATPLEVDAPGSSGLGGIFGGTGRRVMNQIRSRERSFHEHGDHTRAKSIDRLAGRWDDPHGEPSIGLSNTTAEGHMDPPPGLKEESPYIHSLASPASPLPHDFLRAEASECDLSRRSSVSSSSSYKLRSATGERIPTQITAANTSLPRATSDDRFSRAKYEFGPKRMLEEQQSRGRPSSTLQHRPPSALSQAAFPPSPDNETFYQPQQEAKSSRRQSCHQTSSVETSPSSYPVSLQSTTLPSSSSDDQFFSGMSQSTSNPSILSVISANSSILPDDGSILDHHRDPRKDASDETLNPAVPAQEEDDGYAGDHAADSVEDDDSEDDFIEFTRHKAKKTGLSRSECVSCGETCRHRHRRGQASSNKTTRSGSNGTVKKVRSHGENEGTQQAEALEPLSAYSNDIDR